ncbi:HNH/ENDO VII family nuclease [Streptococcus suis]|uniref:HNH/ENDO VII family nuclease n=1 Tax=Streptococcus suis TaxID=1307 RepID=UPI00240EBA92|nr:HNH/ENDO VII family nuclease [Streptococcus suis]MDG3137309.1 hypothetical protein [Streptococcus suis]
MLDLLLGELTDPLSQNLYSYVHNNPVNYTDPSGHFIKGLINGAKKIWNGAKKVYNQAKNFVVNTAKSVANIGKQVIDWVGNKVNQAANWVGTQVNRVTNWVTQKWNNIYQAGQQVYQSASSYAQAQYQQVQARIQEQRQQAIRNEYAQATGIKGTPKSREAMNLLRNWGAALAKTKKIDWKKVAVTAGAIGVGIALTVATGGLGAPIAMAIGGAASGALMSGYDAYTSGQRGWALAGSVVKGAGTGALAGFIGGQFMGAGASVAANVTQNIGHQTVRQVAKIGVEAAVETAIDTGIDLATGNKITGQTVAMNFAFNTFTNGSGSFSSKKGMKADVNTSKNKAGNSTSSAPPPKQDYSQNRKYWKNEVEFNGNKVYQRDDLIDPNLVSSWKEKGKTVTGTNTQRMASGRAPIGPDGKPINLHHVTQKQDGTIAEVTQSFHNQNYSTIHINTGQLPSGINRSDFDKWRSSYWKNRVTDFME